jgi:hypothetical protein
LGGSTLETDPVSVSKIANAAFVNNEWRFIGQRERELSVSGIAGERENNFY